MYEGDTPSAERRAAALSLDRDLLRELLGQEELRELIDPGALAARRGRPAAPLGDHARDRPRRAARRAAPRRRPRPATRSRERVFEGVDADAAAGGAASANAARSACASAASERCVAADEAGLYRDALGAVPPGGLPEAFLADVPDALRELVARYARTHGPFAADELRGRYGVDAGAVLRELERDGALVRGELRPGGSGARLVRRRGAAAPAPRVAGGAAQGDRAGRPAAPGGVPARPGRASTATRGAGAGIDRLREVLVPLQGLALPAEIWERDVLPRRTGAYSPSWLDALCASGELVWVGAGALGRSGPRRAVLPRGRAR